MQKFILLFIALAFFSCNGKKSGKQNAPERNIEKPAALTEIEFDEKMHGFGRIKSGEIVVFTFVFTNTGKNDLIIESVVSDCACVKAKFPKTPVKPGQKGFIEVEFNSSGLYGKQLKSVEIQSNCSEPKHLVIFAEVLNENINFEN